jgi:hypothetical protein
MTNEVAMLAGAVIGVVVFVGGVLLGGWLREVPKVDAPKPTWTGVLPKAVAFSKTNTGVGARVDKQQTVFTMTEERERDIEDGRDRLDEEDGAHD